MRAIVIVAGAGLLAGCVPQQPVYVAPYGGPGTVSGVGQPIQLLPPPVPVTVPAPDAATATPAPDSATPAPAPEAASPTPSPDTTPAKPPAASTVAVTPAAPATPAVITPTPASSGVNGRGGNVPLEGFRPLHGVSGATTTTP